MHPEDKEMLITATAICAATVLVLLYILARS